MRCSSLELLDHARIRVRRFTPRFCDVSLALRAFRAQGLAPSLSKQETELFLQDNPWTSLSSSPEIEIKSSQSLSSPPLEPNGSPLRAARSC